MGRNKLFSIRLTDEIIQALADRFPGLSTVEGIRACIEEVLGTSQGHPLDVIGTVNEILESVYLRLDKLERAIATPDNQEDKDIQGDIQGVTTPDNQEDKDIQGDIQGVTTPDKDIQEIPVDITTTTPDKDIQEIPVDITTTTTPDKDIQEVPVDIQEVTTPDKDITTGITPDQEIKRILARHPELTSNRKRVNFLRDCGVKVLGAKGAVLVNMETIHKYI